MFPINEQFAAASRQFVQAAAQVNRLALDHAEQVIALQLGAFERNVSATFAHLGELAEVRDADGAALLAPEQRRGRVPALVVDQRRDVAAVPRRPAQFPLPQRDEHHPELVASLRQVVVRARRAFRVLAGLEHLVGDEAPQALRQHRIGDAQRLFEVLEPRRPAEGVDSSE